MITKQKFFLIVFSNNIHSLCYIDGLQHKQPDMFDYKSLINYHIRTITLKWYNLTCTLFRVTSQIGFLVCYVWNYKAYTTSDHPCSFNFKQKKLKFKWNLIVLNALNEANCEAHFCYWFLPLKRTPEGIESLGEINFWRAS